MECYATRRSPRSAATARNSDRFGDTAARRRLRRQPVQKSPRVALARQRLAEGFYDSPIVLDRTVERVLAALRRTSAH